MESRASKPKHGALCVICLLLNRRRCTWVESCCLSPGLVLWSFLNAVWFMFYENPQHTTAEMSEHAHMIVCVWNNMATVEHISFVPKRPRQRNVTAREEASVLVHGLCLVSCEGPRAHIAITRPIFLATTWRHGVKASNAQENKFFFQACGIRNNRKHAASNLTREMAYLFVTHGRCEHGLSPQYARPLMLVSSPT